MRRPPAVLSSQPTTKPTAEQPSLLTPTTPSDLPKSANNPPPNNALPIRTLSAPSTSEDSERCSPAPNSPTSSKTSTLDNPSTYPSPNSDDQILPSPKIELLKLQDPSNLISRRPDLLRQQHLRHKIQHLPEQFHLQNESLRGIPGYCTQMIISQIMDFNRLDVWIIRC